MIIRQRNKKTLQFIKKISILIYPAAIYLMILLDAGNFKDGNELFIKFMFVLSGLASMAYFPFLFGLNILQLANIKLKSFIIHWIVVIAIIPLSYLCYLWLFDSDLILRITNGTTLRNELIRILKISGLFIGISFGFGVIFSLGRRFNFKIW
jgi:hypothetical protein